MIGFTRRRALQLSSVVVTSSFAGCMGSGSDFDVEVRNESTDRHLFTLTIKGDFQPIARAMTLSEGYSETYEDLLPSLDYNHDFTLEVVLDGEVVSTTHHNLDDVSDDDGITLTINGPKNISVNIPESDK
jgi:sulfur carrier protein ThiS